MKWLSTLGMGVASLAMVGTTGCGPEEGTPLCHDPVLGPVDEACGIWVSASLGDDANPGTRAAPMASLTAAAVLAFDLDLDVYACGELWTEPFTLPKDVSLRGGFDCEHGWKYSGDSHRTRLETGPGEIPFKTSGYAGSVEISDVDIRAADADVPGGSSIAVLITDFNDVTFRRCVIAAGNAVDGLDGAEIEEIEEPAMAGAAGNPGADACTTANGAGGVAAETACGPDESSRGGNGGDGGATLATDGEAGLPAPSEPKDPSNLQDGDGGKGQSGAEACTPGEPGEPGMAGADGPGRFNDPGRLTNDGFIGADGPDGQPGTSGRGGGGGGAARGGALVCAASPPGGAGGGAGGAGGCGGKAGKGGQAGGSSFAVVVMEDRTDLWFESCELWVGRAGNGGDGAPGQPGGEGGEPGSGGAGAGILQSACQGGKGGKGGNGGGGAGGNGGHTVQIAYADGAFVTPYPNTTYHGENWGGSGGQGGHPGPGLGWIRGGRQRRDLPVRCHGLSAVDAVRATCEPGCARRKARRRMAMKGSRVARRWAGLAGVLLGTGAALGSLGCTYTCEDTFTCLPLEPPCPEDPAEAVGGRVPARCGLWVSASLGDDGNDGSQEAPLATLGEAAARASTGPRRVYACAEGFNEAITWPAGVSLHGGFFCTDLDWQYGGGHEPTIVTAPADEIPLTLGGSVHPEPSMLTDLKVIAEAAKKPGGSSIAVLALSDARAEIRRSKLESGNGADGADGDDGDHFGNPAKDGLHGNNGAAACTGAIGIGGEMVALACDEDASFGGQGGHGGELAANAGDDGEVAPAPNPQGFGLGGHGEDLAAGLFCTSGLGGAAGKDGDPGLGGAWPAQLTAAGYVGAWGADGKPGRAGQGGGGGGASAGNAACGAVVHGGAGGGSGGAGGCGGKGGRGGQPGGASIGLAMLTDAIVMMNVDIFAGNGGDGGRGGVPQQGGQGGLPGIGGAGLQAAGGPNPGCVGGGGGYGGDGGHAGGGLGGASLAIAYVGAQAPSTASVGLHNGQAGKGGAGSDASLSSARGQDGKTGKMEALLP